MKVECTNPVQGYKHIFKTLTAPKKETIIFFKTEKTQDAWMIYASYEPKDGYLPRYLSRRDFLLLRNEPADLLLESFSRKIWHKTCNLFITN